MLRDGAHAILAPYVEHLWGWRLAASHSAVAVRPDAGGGCRRRSLSSSPLGLAPVGALPPRGGCCAAGRPRPGRALIRLLQSPQSHPCKKTPATSAWDASWSPTCSLNKLHSCCNTSCSHACMLTCVPPLPWLRPCAAPPLAAASAAGSGSLAPESLCSRLISASAWQDDH